jgi:hypothetical protein
MLLALQELPRLRLQAVPPRRAQRSHHLAGEPRSRPTVLLTAAAVIVGVGVGGTALASRLVG